MDPTRTKHILEACLLVAARPMSVAQLEALFEGDDERPTRDGIRAALAALGADYEGRGIELVEVASGFRLQSRAEVQRWVSRLFQERTPRYSRALLETLVLVAYRQPITRGEIEEVRGVAVSSNIVRTLQERQWIREVGYKDVPGKPALLGTTRQFLDYFNLKRLEDLPTLGELKDLDAFDAVLAETGLVEGAVDGPAANDAGDANDADRERVGAEADADAGEGEDVDVRVHGAGRPEASAADDAAPRGDEVPGVDAGATDEPDEPDERGAPGPVGAGSAGAAQEPEADVRTEGRPTGAGEVADAADDPEDGELVIDVESVDLLLGDAPRPSGRPDGDASGPETVDPASPAVPDDAGSGRDEGAATSSEADRDGADVDDDERAGPAPTTPVGGAERPYEDPRAALLRVIDRFGAEHRRDLEGVTPSAGSRSDGDADGGADGGTEARATDPAVASVPAEPPDRDDRVP